MNAAKLSAIKVKINNEQTPQSEIDAWIAAHPAPARRPSPAPPKFPGGLTAVQLKIVR